MITRRHFLHWVWGLPLLSAFPFRISEGWAQGSSPLEMVKKSSIGEFFNGEELTYEIGLWIIKQAAIGRLTFQPTERKGRYVATLQGETLGVLGFVARYRMDTYRAVMEEIENGTRLRSVSFEEHVKVGNKLRKKMHTFDYQRRKWATHTMRQGGKVETTEEEIPEGKIFDDFLTAAYNFRYGAYGTVERGRRYTVPTFPRKGGVANYEVRVATKDEEERRRREEKARDGKEYLIRLSMDRELTHSKEGVIEGWLSRDIYPIEGAIKDVILYGDIRGTLIKRSKV